MVIAGTPDRPGGGPSRFRPESQAFDARDDPTTSDEDVIDGPSRLSHPHFEPTSIVAHRIIRKI